MKYLLIIPLLVLATGAQAVCFKSLEEAGNGMSRKFGEVPKGMGLEMTGIPGETPLIVFVNPKTNHWSIVQKMPSGQFCATMEGSHWVVPAVGLPS